LMRLIEKDGRSRVREMEIWRRDFGELKKTLIRFNSPAEIRGTGFLTTDLCSQYKTVFEVQKTHIILMVQQG
ncbi:MAG: hypothetical protein AB1487_09540, partial [Thermodesulfobacteriota bacterium]